MYKPEWLSKPAELLFEKWAEPYPPPYDVLIVGSGYGGAVAAARLSGCSSADGKELSVCVLERGSEHVPGTFPNASSDLPGHVRFSRFDDPVPGGQQDGLFDLRIGKDVTVLVANGLGGGSLINAGVTAIPNQSVFTQGWPKAIEDAWSGAGSTLERDFLHAQKMLGAEPARSSIKTPEHETVDLAKHQQFVAVMKGLDAKPATITVTQDPGTNPHGIEQPGCAQCGDCATGCNVGAKNTLTTTYLAKAWRQHAEIYTGATVSHVARCDGHWAVFAAPTTPSRPLEKAPQHRIHARHVILAAGTLGSTEILMRSRELAKLTVSKQLGSRVSTNGDMLAAMYKERANVNAVAEESIPLRERLVGPTITGIAQTFDPNRGRLTIEELAVPGALRRVFEEIVTTSALLERLGRPDKEEHPAFSRRDPKRGLDSETSAPVQDPAAINPDIIAGCQLFAAMGDDKAKGRLRLVHGWNDKANADRVHDGAVCVDWPKAGKEDVFAFQDEFFRKLAESTGWTYLPNPLWQPLPDSLANALSGEKPTGLLFSVHPLGGCPMADRAEDGVVDHLGRVFAGTEGDTLHEGLLVLDGSIIPVALGVNPLLTITAVAERAIRHYIQDRRWISSRAGRIRDLPTIPRIEETAVSKPVTAIRFSERMTGTLTLATGAAAVDADLTLEFDEVPDLADFLRQPLHALRFTGNLQLFDRNTGTAVKTAVRGDVELLVRGATSRWERVLKALWTNARTRLLPDLLGKAKRKTTNTKKNFFASMIELVKGYLALASNVGEVRYLFYEMELLSGVADSNGNKLPAGTKVVGRKTLEYAIGANPWRQLVAIPLTASAQDGRQQVDLGTLTVDLVHLLRSFSSPLQITKQRDLPAAWMDLASLALFVARIILKIHFWSFRLPKYQKHEPMRDMRRLPAALEPLHMERHVVGPPTADDAQPFLLLTRYQRERNASDNPVLLIHGLGSGGIQFATTRVNPNLAQHLVATGFDVWVAELRTSIALPSSVHQWTLDDVALNDIPRLVDFVLKESGREQVEVVAHCIGSAMFCTAVLNGKLQHPSGASKIRSAALMQVGPLITLSKGTKLRALAVAPMRRFLPDGFVDFSVDDRAGWGESLVDRLLNTYPYPPDEAKQHRLGLFDNEHIANCNRWAAIDGLMFRHENLSDEMLANLGEILGHSSTTVWAQPIQYGFLERLTDSEGANAYVTSDNIRSYFNFPVCFLHGTDNNVFLPLTSFRSRELLRSVHGKTFPAEVQLLKGYRHLDPLIGRDAGRDVFPKISEFLKREVTVDSTRHEEAGYYFRRPLIGPLIGWFRYDQTQGTWVARVWCRLDDLRSPVSFAAIRVRSIGQPEGTVQISYPVPAPGTTTNPIDTLIVGPMDTLWCVDVKVAYGPGEYEISVFSAHEGIEEQLSDEDRKVYRAAEVNSGRRPSTLRPPLSLGLRGSEASVTNKPQEFERWRAFLHDSLDALATNDKTDQAIVQVPAERISESLEIAVASCRYPGWLVDRSLADAAFGKLHDLLNHRDANLSALFLIGDQIYSDATAGVFDHKSRRERFYEAYREAWTAPNARAVFGRLPVYMMMDDHEAGNDWHPDDVLSEKERALRKEGLAAFKQYQWLHSPGNRPGQCPPPFWYDFELQGFPVFVCDTRSGRKGRERILDETQFAALTGWLRDKEYGVPSDCAARPKFVVSPSVVVPFAKPLRPDGTAQCPSRSDSWDGFPHQLVSLFSFIARERISNVVFLCGDAHLSMHTEIRFENENKEQLPFRAWCITASAMYAPYPFVNRSVFDFERDPARSILTLPGLGTMHYRVTTDTNLNGFARVTARRHASSGSWEIASSVVPMHAEGSPTKADGVLATGSCVATPVFSRGLAAP